MIPQINIKYNKFLDPIFIIYINSHDKWKGWTPPDINKVKEQIADYKKYWNEIEKIVLPYMQEVSGIEFQRNIIDVHVVSGNPRPFSFPIIIKSSYKKDEFVSILIEELFHVLMGENRERFVKMWNEVKVEFNENDSITNHILIYRMMRKVYKKIDRVWEPDFTIADYSKAFELSK